MESLPEKIARCRKFTDTEARILICAFYIQRDEGKVPLARLAKETGINQFLIESKMRLYKKKAYLNYSHHSVETVTVTFEATEHFLSEKA